MSFYMSLQIGKRSLLAFLLLAIVLPVHTTQAASIEALRTAVGELQSRLTTVEQLPAGAVLGVSTNRDGYSDFTPSNDTRIIYVSSSEGNDSNDGLSEQSPKRTIAAGKDLLRYGYPDWMLLKKGDVWTNEVLGGFSNRSEARAIEGRSAREPVLIGAYGNGDRPLLRVTSMPFWSWDSRSGGNYLAIVGLDFYAYQRDPDAATFDQSKTGNLQANIMNETDWLLFEDNRFRYIQLNVMAGSGTTLDGVTIRRNVFAGNYSTDSHAQCIFSSKTRNLTVEYNVFFQCGWNPNVSGANSTIFNRSAYLSSGDGNTTYRGNV